MAGLLPEHGLIDEQGKVKKGRIPLAVVPADEDVADLPCECYDGGGCSLG